MTEDPKPGPDPTVSDSKILELFEEANDPVLSTAEVAEKLPITRRAAYNRLTSLADQNILRRKEIGGRNTVWWLK